LDCLPPFLGAQQDPADVCLYDFNELLDIDAPVAAIAGPSSAPLSDTAIVHKTEGRDNDHLFAPPAPCTSHPVDPYLSQNLATTEWSLDTVNFSIVKTESLPEQVRPHWATLLDYFFNRLSTIVFVCARGDQNELVRVLAPMALTSDCVLYSLLAWSANHLQDTGEPWSSIAETLTSMALDELRIASARRLDRQIQECALGGWLILCAIEVCVCVCHTARGSFGTFVISDFESMGTPLCSDL
jgi:hypothetical protein